MTRNEILKTAKPILFNTEMVKAILDGRKTVTRRIVKNNPEECTSKVVNGVCKICDDKGGFYLPDDYVKARSLYQVGDYLYVRETWKMGVCDPAGGGYELTDLYLYKADEPIDTTGIDTENKWRPSIHMPKEAARIFLRVTDVRVERLQDISRDDTVAEGAPCGLRLYGGYCGNGGLCVCDDYKQEFATLWNSTVKKSDIDKYGWDANPWVWVITFEKVEVE